jgi:hypothetical protein
MRPGLKPGFRIVSFAASAALALAMAGSANALGIGGVNVGIGGVNGVTGGVGQGAPSASTLNMGGHGGLPTVSSGHASAPLPVIVLPTTPSAPTVPHNIAGVKIPGSKPYGGPNIPPGGIGRQATGPSKSSTLPVVTLPTTPSAPTVPHNIAGVKIPGSKPYGGPNIPPNGIGGHPLPRI